MYMTPLCWENWQAHFRARGYRTVAPPWPEHELSAEAQRAAHPNARLAALTLAELVEHHAALVRTLDGPPILVGHSMGGLVVQLLLQAGAGVAGVAIDSAPPRGVISLKWAFLKSNWGAINPFASDDMPIRLSFDQFQYAFLNTLPEGEHTALYERHAVPESRRVGRGPTTDAARIDFTRARPPLLMIAGAGDHTIPASLNRANYARYQRTPAITDFREFPGRCHFIIGQPGWEEVADFALEWIEKHAPRQP